MRLPLRDITRPGNDEIFEICDGLGPSSAREVALKRPNRYGIASSSCFVTLRSTLKPAHQANFPFTCAFYGEESEQAEATG